jgi:hypothetical protein
MRILHEVLNEFLAVEVGGQKLYERALEVVSDTEVRSKFRQYHKQMIRYQKILIDVICKLDGNPQAQQGEGGSGKSAGLFKNDGSLGTFRR